VWRAIEQAGGHDAYIQAQLAERGFLVERRPADQMSKRELERYKKELKTEAAEKRKLDKEAWQAYLATHIVHLGDGVFWNDSADLDKWDLDSAEARAADNELPAIDKPGDLAELLGLSIPELRWLSYHRDAAKSIHYTRFTIPKKSGGERAIWAPMPKLKKAQHAILRQIAEKLPVHGAAHGFFPNRSIATNAQVHVGSKTIVQMDLLNFFPTVTLPRVKGVFRKAGYREQIATLLALLCTEAPREVVEHNGETFFVALGPRALPQGAPTSPALTNTLCLRLDRRLTGLAAKLGWRYSRYADDLTFSLPANHKGSPCVGKLLGSAIRVIADEGFQVHPDKTRVSREGGRQKVTGLVVNGDGPPRVPRELKRNLRAAVHNVAAGKGLRDDESLESLGGMAAYVFMTDPALGKKLLVELSRLGPCAAGKR
jgi:hypothetical protein